MQAWISHLKRNGPSAAPSAIMALLLLLLAPPKILAEVPTNDFCPAALTIPGAGPFPYFTPWVDITSATTNGELLVPLCQPVNSRGVWYVFTPSQTGPYTMSTCSPSTTVDDTVMGVFTSVAGCSGPFTQVGCDDDNCEHATLLTQVTAQLFADTTYYIVVAQYDVAPPAPGKGIIEVVVTREVAPSNDTCDTAISVTLNIPVPGSTLGATNNYILADNACFSGIGQAASPASGRDVVYTFTAPEDGDYSVKAANYSTASGLNLVLYVAGYCKPGAGPQMVTNCLAAANRNAASSAEEVSCLALTNGQKIYIYIDDGSVNPGSSFRLEVTRCQREVEPNNSPPTASRLAFGMSGVINSAGDIDCFSLGNFPAGWRAFVMVDGEAANIPDFQLRVISYTNTLEFDDNDNDVSHGQSSPNVAGTPLPGGPVAARVNYNGAVSVEPYRIYGVVQPPLEQAPGESEPNNLPETANRDDRNYYSGTLSGPAPSDDADVFSFSVNDGDLILLSLDGDPLRDNTPINAKLELLDEFGNVLVTADDSNAGSSTNVSNGLFAEAPRSPGEAIVYRSPGEANLFVRVSIGTSSTGPSGAGDYLLSICRNGGRGSQGATHAVEMTEVAVTSPAPEGSPAVLSGLFNDLDTGEVLTLVVTWGDGTTNVFPHPGGQYQFQVTHEFGGGVPPVMAPAQHHIQLSVTDSQGNQAMGSIDVTITNGAPAVTLDLESSEIAEGSEAVLNGSFKDLSPFDTHVVVINWGDGSPGTTIVPAAGERVFSSRHLYEDEESSGPYQIVATVSDNHLGVGSGSVPLAVTNATPQLSDVSATSPIYAGHASTLTGNFFDAGLRDSHTLTVDWGDGSELSAFNYPPATTNFAVSHEFINGPTNYTVQLTLTDDDHGTNSATATVQVLVEVVFMSVNYSPAPPPPQMHLVLQGKPGKTYRVEKSSDLQTWSEVITLQADATGHLETTDAVADSASRFYRAVSVP